VTGTVQEVTENVEIASSLFPAPRVCLEVFVHEVRYVPVSVSRAFLKNVYGNNGSCH
jgi:hypothetical protein